MFKLNKKLFFSLSSGVTNLFFHPEKKKIQTFLYCTLGATMLWFLNALSKERTEIINHPVHFVYHHKKFIAVKPFPKEIPISVKGSGWQIMKKVLRIRVKPIRYEIKDPLNSPNFILGSSLKVYVTNVMDGLKLEEILVDTIFMNLDQRIDRTFRIRVDSNSLSLKEGFRVIDPISVYPDKVALNGPRKVLSALPDPLPIEISDRRIDKPFRKKIPLVIKHKHAGLILKDTEKISVSFSPTLFVTKSANLIIDVANFPQGTSYSLHRDHRITEITYTFAQKDLGKVRLSDFRIFADFRTFRVTDTTVALILKHKPAFVRNQDISFRPRVKLDYDGK